jgi:hypothetical protein
MIARVLTLDCVNYIFKDMEKRRISREEKENLILDLYYNQNKTYREITEIVGAYPREIKAILKKAGLSRSQSISSQAYQLFSEDKTVTQVAITLDIRQPQASEFFTEYWLLQQQDQLYKIFQEVKNNLQFFLQLYRQAIAAGMSIQDVIRVLNIAKNDLRSVANRCQELKKQADSLAAGNSNAAKIFQDLSDQISDTKRTVAQYESLIKERNFELENINIQKNRLQAYMTYLQNNSEEFSKIKDTIKKEMEGTLTDPRQILMLAFRSLVESARKDISKFSAIVYNLPVAIAYSPDYSNNEDTYERVILNEAEELYDKMMMNRMDKAISGGTSKSEPPLGPKTEPRNIKKDSNSLVAYTYRMEEGHSFSQSEIDDI